MAVARSFLLVADRADSSYSERSEESGTVEIVELLQFLKDVHSINGRSVPSAGGDYHPADAQ